MCVFRSFAVFVSHSRCLLYRAGLGPLTNLTHRDASAAAIAASGLVELAGYVQDRFVFVFVSVSVSVSVVVFAAACVMASLSVCLSARAKSYRGYAALAIEALGGAYASDFDKQEGAILHCDAADCDVPWADYYLLEAIKRSEA